MNIISNKNIGRTVCFILLTALLFSLSVTVFASSHNGQQPQKGLVYRLHATSTLESAASDPPVEPLDIPDFLLPKTGGFLLPDEDEVLEYLTPPPAQEPPPRIPHLRARPMHRRLPLFRSRSRWTTIILPTQCLSAIREPWA
jgi:hypothetical protein